MKAADATTLAILATAQYWKAELYQITLASGTNLYFTAYDAPLTIGGNTYLNSLVIARKSIKQERGVKVQTIDLDVAPQRDAPVPVTVDGYPFLEAVRRGSLDGARVLMSKMFMANPADVGHNPVAWFQGRVSAATAGRAIAQITISSDLILLNTQMPRNVLQTGCVHALYDAGCTLSRGSFTTTGSVSTVGGAGNVITTGLTQADHYFELGVLTFTSGAANGLKFAVQTFLHASGQVTFVKPLPVSNGAVVVLPADTFSIVPGCDKQQATCNTKFSNLVHFRGYPYVPVPQVLYDGGTVNPQVPLVGSQAGGVTGSNPGSGYGRGYHP